MKFVLLSTGYRMIYYLYELGLDIDFPRLVAECFSDAEPNPINYPICFTFCDVTLPLTMKENELFAFAGFLLYGLYELRKEKMAY